MAANASLNKPKSAEPVAELYSGANRPEQVRLSESYGRLPLSFEVNEGQHDRECNFWRGQRLQSFPHGERSGDAVSAGDRRSRTSK